MKQNWKRKFFTIAAGQMASLIGSSAVQFALIWWIASETASVTLMGLSGIVAFLPAAVLSPAAGIAADHYSRKAICIFSDLFIGAVAAAFALLLWRFELPVWTALLILFLRSVGNTFQQPAIQALIPQFVPEDELMRVGGWNQMMSSGSFLLGPALGAVLYAAFPLPVVLLTDLIGAVLASSLLAAVSIPPMRRVPHEKRGSLHELREGLTVFREDRRLGLMIAAETLSMIFILPMASFYPLMTSDYFHASAWHGSAVEIAYALGMMVAAFLMGSVIKPRRPLWAAYLGMLGMGAACAVCGILPPQMWAWYVFTLACALLGAFCNVHNVPLVAYMQATIPGEKMGRAFALTALMSSIALPLGLAVCTPIAEQIGVHRWFLISGVGICLITVPAMVLHLRLEHQK